IGRMISRTAYAQLGYSPWLLAGTLVGLILTYLAPPALALLGTGFARWAGLAAWLLMAVAFQPMLRLYRRSPLRGPLLPLARALVVRRALAEGALSAVLGMHLVKGYRQDATRRGYAGWGERVVHCGCSASPVGRFVLDGHGESRALWPANDAVCNPRQVINH